MANCGEKSGLPKAMRWRAGGIHLTQLTLI
jgi:hypothetical protein